MTPRVLLTGATGYVGGRLLHLLEAQGHSVRCLARRTEVLEHKVGLTTEVVRGEVLDPTTLGPAFSRDRGRVLPCPLDGLEWLARAIDRVAIARFAFRSRGAPMSLDLPTATVANPVAVI